MRGLIEPFIEHQGEKRGFWLRKPRAIGEKLIIAKKSGFLRVPGKTVIFLESRTAFGTGGHGTTEGCLVALEKIIKGGETVLDVGTGTGILAIAARKLGAGHVTAIDIDPVACRETVNNIALNGIDGGIDVIEGGIERAKGQHDVIVANLRTPLLVDLVDGLMEILAGRGLAIFSGIMEEELHPFLSVLEGHGMDALEVERIRGWMTVVSRKGGGLTSCGR
ncbi:MAG: 50S ribosomal protein L11 methyltransferase [Deltaproteobacteria bacterium]|nr:50S ribosomal protein L11 methyltransferase [Deltaproteobacteria bacterium]